MRITEYWEEGADGSKEFMQAPRCECAGVCRYVRLRPVNIFAGYIVYYRTQVYIAITLVDTE